MIVQNKKIIKQLLKMTRVNKAETEQQNRKCATANSVGFPVAEKILQPRLSRNSQVSRSL